MTDNAAFKKQVRAYAAQHHLGYTEARTRLLAHPGLQGTTYRAWDLILIVRRGQQIVVTINEYGLVEDQDRWQGDPWSLLGFEDPNGEPFDMVHSRQALTDGTDVTGLLPVFQDAHREWATWTAHTVQHVTETTRTFPDYPSQKATVVGEGGEVTIEIGDVLAALNELPADVDVDWEDLVSIYGGSRAAAVDRVAPDGGATLN